MWIISHCKIQQHVEPSYPHWSMTHGGRLLNVMMTPDLDLHLGKDREYIGMLVIKIRPLCSIGINLWYSHTCQLSFTLNLIQIHTTWSLQVCWKSLNQIPSVLSWVNHRQFHQGLTRSTNVHCFCTSHKTSHVWGTWSRVVLVLS